MKNKIIDQYKQNKKDYNIILLVESAIIVGSFMVVASLINIF
jgi:hypothetical protein